ncbi:hypothetical protein H4R21_004860 [Coemansia helicoidea]|uniref:Uncharacterized protein n=1 Tax=Coemansia helicoidea TaxID=1286919 RepID=A0ACC1KWM1_9FUNG|nr:hypothetical protein H4R21_004860 [Coemansia helicoidea]
MLVFLGRVFSKKNAAANPQCKINVLTTTLVADPATVEVTFKDGNKMHIDGRELHGDDIIAQVEKYSNKLSQQEDLKNQ